MAEDIAVATEEVLETVPEEASECGSHKGVKIAVGIGISVIMGVLVCKYVIKPIADKIKAKKGSGNDISTDGQPAKGNTKK